MGMKCVVKAQTTGMNGRRVEMSRALEWAGSPEETIRLALKAREDHGHPFWGEAVTVSGQAFSYERIINPDNGEPEEWTPPAPRPFQAWDAVQALKEAKFSFPVGGSRYLVPQSHDDPIELWVVIEYMTRRSIAEIIRRNNIKTMEEFRLVLVGQHIDAEVVETEMGNFDLSIGLAGAIIGECQGKLEREASTNFLDEYADLFSALLASVRTRTEQVVDSIKGGQ